MAFGKAGDRIAFYNISSAAGFGEYELVTPPTPTMDPASVAVMRAAFATMMAPPYSAHFVNEVEQHFEKGYPVKATLRPVGSSSGGGGGAGGARGGAGGAGAGGGQLVGMWSVGVLESTDNGGARVVGSSLHDGYARAFMVKGRDALYDGSRWARAGGIHVGQVQASAVAAVLPAVAVGGLWQAWAVCVAGLVGACVCARARVRRGRAWLLQQVAPARQRAPIGWPPHRPTVPTAPSALFFSLPHPTVVAFPFAVKAGDELA